MKDIPMPSENKGFVLPQTTKARMFKALFVAMGMIQESKDFNKDDPRYLYISDIFIDAHCELLEEVREDNRIVERKELV